MRQGASQQLKTVPMKTTPTNEVDLDEGFTDKEKELRRRYKNLKGRHDQEEPKIDRNINVFINLAVLLGILGLIPILLVGYEEVLVGQDLHYNEVGDFIGGFTGSFWSLAGLFIIYIAFLSQRKQVMLQQVELAATLLEVHGQKVELRKQGLHLRRQNIEHAFFNMLRFLNDLVGNIDITVSEYNPSIKKYEDKTLTGRDAIGYMYSEMRNLYGELEKERKVELHKGVSFDVFMSNFEYPNGSVDSHHAYETIGEMDLEDVQLDTADQAMIIKKVINNLLSKRSTDILPYLRSVDQLLSYIDREYGEDDDNTLEYYIRLVFAQTTPREVGLMFYVGLIGWDEFNFAHYVERYDLLKYVSGRNLMRPEHAGMYSTSK